MFGNLGFSNTGVDHIVVIIIKMVVFLILLIIIKLVVFLIG